VQVELRAESCPRTCRHRRRRRQHRTYRTPRDRGRTSRALSKRRCGARRHHLHPAPLLPMTAFEIICTACQLAAILACGQGASCTPYTDQIHAPRSTARAHAEMTGVEPPHQHRRHLHPAAPGDNVERAYEQHTSSLRYLRVTRARHAYHVVRKQMRHAVSHAHTPKWQMSSLQISAAHAPSSAAPDDSVESI